jgi:hypothetical protein
MLLKFLTRRSVEMVDDNTLLRSHSVKLMKHGPG